VDALAGIWLVARTPRLWGMAFGPLVAALIAYIVLGIVGGILIVPRLPELPILRDLTPASGIVVLLGSLLFVVLWVLLFSFVFVLFAGIFAGLVWERFSREVEREAGATDPPQARIGCAASGADTIARLILAVTLAVAALLLSGLLGPIPGIIAAAIVGLLDFTAPACQRRGMLLDRQAGHLASRLDGRTLGFALVAGLVSLVPLIGVLVMPGLVAGGTLLVRRQDALDRSAPP
jgi:CysZ protein